MRLNNVSYAHKQIRLLCFQLERITGLKLKTDLSENFEEIRFENELSYIIIDFKNYAYFTLSYNLDAKEEATIEDILTHTSWLYIGYNFERLAKLRERKQKRTEKKKKERKM